MIRLLAVDMDGTCLNEKKQISDRTMQALIRADEAGILVVPTTGRSLRCLPLQLQGRGFYRYVISSNGAVVTDTKTGELLFEAKIPWQQGLELAERCEDKNLGVSAHVDHQFLIQGHLLRLIGRIGYGKDASNTTYIRSLSSYLRKNRKDPEEIQLFHLNDRMRHDAASVLDGYDCLQQARTEYYTEIYSQDASKGTALAALAGKLGIPREQIACIGDGENDLSMFRVSGLRLAMGNSIGVLRDQADAVLASNREDGAAEAIEQYILA